MNYIDLKIEFSKFEKLGFSLTDTADTSPLMCASRHHKIRASFLDHYSNIECRIALNEQPMRWVDCYSVLTMYDRPALEAFLNRGGFLSDNAVAEFVTNSLTGSCVKVFERTTVDAWTDIYQFHVLAVKKRNRVFWARLSGLGFEIDGEKTAIF